MSNRAEQGALMRIPRARGQILSTDLVVSLSLFLGAVMIFLIAWSTLSYSYLESKADTNMQSAMLAISDTLVLSPGSPSDWEFGDVADASSLGLASSKNELSARKIADFFKVSPEDLWPECVQQVAQTRAEFEVGIDSILRLPDAEDLETKMLEKNRWEHVEGALKMLPPRQEQVLRLRFGLDGDDARTCDEVAEEFDVTGGRIGQIEDKALDTLRKKLRKLGDR